MNIPKTTLTHIPRIKRAVLFIASVALFIVAIIVISPLIRAFEYDPDEGFNLMKSWLFMKGYLLYDQIWSDQPPLFTVILSYWLKLFGLSVYHARILILTFSAMLLWAFYQTIKTISDRLCAFFATLLLLLSSIYLRLSVSIMIGIPSLAFAMLSIYFIALYRKLRLILYLIISAAFMAISLQTKLFTAFLLLLILIEIIFAGREVRGKNKIFSHIFIWLVTFFIVYFSIAAIFFHYNLNMLIQQLFLSHLKTSAFDNPEYSFSVISCMLFQDYDIVLLVLFSLILFIVRKERRFLLPILWLVFSFLILIKHRPVWEHYYLLISIPSCWIAAFCVSNLFRESNNKIFNYKKIERALHWLSMGLIILVILMIPIKINRIYKSLDVGTTPQERSVIELISKYSRDSHWIVSNRSIFAFYAKIPMPPELAVISEKRALTKNLTTDYLIYILDRYKPEQILLSIFEKFGHDPKLISYIQQRYSMVSDGDIKLYVLKYMIK